MKPARLFYFLWGRLLPRVPFSSDALGMPREIMGVYIFFQKNTQYLVLHRHEKQYLVTM